MDAVQFFRSGWLRFPHDAAVADWAARARPVADQCLARTEHRRRWLRCGGTWFVGVNVLPNDAAGAVAEAGVPPLGGPALRFIGDVLGLAGVALDRAQVSVCFPGYPLPSDGESEGAFRFRRERDAAHVDGLRRHEGRRRRLGEPHGFILGVPLTDPPEGAAPLVVFEGSHEIVRRALRARLGSVPPRRWADEDVTDAYVAARRECFDTCRRVPVHARPGEAYLIHRLALHGVAPWAAGVEGERVIAYFRPNPFAGATPEWWLERA
ncbi:MAG: hypothetical protein JXB36_10410 [Gammaproteobacteria bacterium]|nr:hypothetical protein [Gammaproteobacteria bacterium]